MHGKQFYRVRGFYGVAASLPRRPFLIWPNRTDDTGICFIRNGENATLVFSVRTRQTDWRVFAKTEIRTGRFTEHKYRGREKIVEYLVKFCAPDFCGFSLNIDRKGATQIHYGRLFWVVVDHADEMFGFLALKLCGAFRWNIAPFCRFDGLVVCDVFARKVLVHRISQFVRVRFKIESTVCHNCKLIK